MSERRTPIEMMLGSKGEAPRCFVRGELAMHWFGATAHAGSKCLCGKTKMKPSLEEPKQ